MKFRFLRLSSALAIGMTICIGLEHEAVAKIADNGLDDNGLDDNGLDDNGLDDNGLDDNGLDDNGLDDNGLDDNGLWGGSSYHGLPFGTLLGQPLTQDFLQSTASGVPAALANPIYGKSNSEMLKYIWKCAMPAGAALSANVYFWGNTTFFGTIGIAPEWATGACDTNCQQKVTACLLAHTNVYHRPVKFSLCADGYAPLGDLEPCGDTPPDADFGYVEPEGRFFGNMFDSNLTYKKNTCSDADNTPLLPHTSARACISHAASCRMNGMGSCEDQPWLSVLTGTLPNTGTTQVTNVIRTYLNPTQEFEDFGTGDLLCSDKEVTCEAGELNCPPPGKINCGDCASEVYYGVHGSTTQNSDTHVADIAAYDSTGKVVYVGTITNGALLENVPSWGQPAPITNSTRDMFLMVRDGATIMRLTRFAVGDGGANVPLTMAVGLHQIFIGGKHFISAFDKRSLTPQWTVNESSASFDYVWIDPDGTKVHASGSTATGGIHRMYEITDGTSMPTVTSTDWQVSCQSPTGELFGVKRAPFTGNPNPTGDIIIEKFNANGNLQWSVARWGIGAGVLEAIVGCRVSNDGSTLVVVNREWEGIGSALLTIDASTGAEGWLNWIFTWTDNWNKFEITTMADTVDDYIVVGGQIRGDVQDINVRDSDDAFVAAYRLSDGTRAWLRREAGVGHDSVDAFTVDAKHRLWMAGTYPGSPLLEGQYVDNNLHDPTVVTSMIVGVGPLTPVDDFTGSSGVVFSKTITDFNNDGKSDVFWVDADGTSRAWTMSGLTSLQQGTFYPSQSSDWQIVGTQGDFNGDGKSDLLWWNTSTSSAKITLMNGTTIASDGPVPYAQNIAATWTVFDSAGDYNNDGKSDILWWNPASSSVYLALHDGVAAINGAYLYHEITGWEIKSAGGDYNGDGKSDILFWNEDQKALYLTLMNGVNILQEAYAASGIAPGWSIADGKGDYDGDGKSDVLWQKSATGELWHYLVDGTSVRFNDSGPLDNLPSAAWTVVDGTSDFNGDGKSDIVFKNPQNGDVKIWLMSGGTHTATADYIAATNAAFGPNHDWDLVSAHHDVNGDGKADLMGVHGDGSVSIWEMDGTNILNSGHLDSP